MSVARDAILDVYLHLRFEDEKRRQYEVKQVEN
jgi:hypothetical protein